MKAVFSGRVLVVGGGLAGSEAAWQLAERGIKVRLLEMRPGSLTPAHETGLLGELVCSNSLGGDRPSTPAGILKEELRRLGSVVMECAEANRVPAGGALAVDRAGFAGLLTERVSSHPNIEVAREEARDIPDGPVILASGPLTSEPLALKMKELIGEGFLYFYDAVAPVVTLESVDTERSFRGNRYGTSGDYINCPMDERTYRAFWRELVNAERAPLRSFEDDMRCFEGCLPIEVIAERGEETLLYGPLRPVGLGGEGCAPYHAVAQLRQDNREGTLYNMVGFQTNLKWGEQERVFRMIPALRSAEFVRKGVMHRNLFVCAPAVLDGFLRPKGRSLTFLAGQITGVEGYVESTAMGLASSLFMYAALAGAPMPRFPRDTAIGALLRYLETSIPCSFQPMNVNLGIFPRLTGKKIRGRKERCEAYNSRAQESLAEFIAGNDFLFAERA